MSTKVIAVDFDGTLCHSEYPACGPPVWETIRRLQWEQDRGAKVILWTCREGNALQAALNWCKALGIRFDAVNDNLPERIALYGNNCRKVGADEYWDDNAVRP